MISELCRNFFRNIYIHNLEIVLKLFNDWTKERSEDTGLKKWNWTLMILILIGFVIGRFIGTYFEGTGFGWLNYGQAFGLSEPVVLDMGFILLTFGLKIQINIASVIGVIISLAVYRFIR